MLPGEHLVIAPHPVIIKIRIQSAILQRLLPAFKIKHIRPAVKALPALPGQIQRLAQTAVATGEDTFHNTGLSVMILEGNIFDPCRFNQKTLLPANLLQRILRCPLKRRIGFRHKGGRTDGYLAAPFACNLFKLPLYLFRQLGNGQHVLICLTGQADHEIQFNFFPAVGKGRAHRMQQVFFRNALVDYVTHPLTARLRRKARPH